MIFKGVFIFFSLCVIKINKTGKPGDSKRQLPLVFMLKPPINTNLRTGFDQYLFSVASSYIIFLEIFFSQHQNNRTCNACACFLRTTTSWNSLPAPVVEADSLPAFEAEIRLKCIYPKKRTLSVRKTPHCLISISPKAIITIKD